MSTPSVQRYAMTPREKQIEEFYLAMISRILQAKEDQERALRSELKRIADSIGSQTTEYRR